MPRADRLHRPIGPGELDEVTERSRVAENLGRGLIVPYLRHDPHAEPVILVHGINASPADLRTIADHLAQSPRFQVYIYLYEDRRRYLDQVAVDLAHDLGLLHDRGQRVRIVAHSMGGIVARCAVNSLVDPKWLTREADDLRGLADPDDFRLPNIKDFPSVDVITVDTPWRGFRGPRMNLRNVLVGERSFVDMIANSDVFKNLHRVALPGNVRIHHVEADNRGAGVEEDRIIGLGELDDRDLDHLLDHFHDRPSALGRDRHLELKNQLRALEDEADYPAISMEIRLDAQRGVLDRARLRHHLERLCPSLPGSHVTVLEQSALLSLLDHTFGRGTA